MKIIIFLLRMILTAWIGFEHQIHQYDTIEIIM